MPTGFSGEVVDAFAVGNAVGIELTTKFRRNTDKEDFLRGFGFVGQHGVGLPLRTTGERWSRDSV
jgi:hypothetical protein